MKITAIFEIGHDNIVKMKALKEKLLKKSFKILSSKKENNPKLILNRIVY